MNIRRQLGFTLIEVLVGIAMLAVIAGFAMPAFSRLTDQRKVVSVKNSLTATLRYAQSEATKSPFPIEVCASSDFTTCTGAVLDWKKGWLVQLLSDPPTTLKVFQAPKLSNNQIVNITVTNPPAISSGSAITRVTFNPNGLPFPVGAIFRVCDERTKALLTATLGPSGAAMETKTVPTICPT